MVYFTGDIHGFPWGVYNFCEDHKLMKDDIVVLLGDVGANYHNSERDNAMKAVLTKLAPTFLCIHGINLTGAFEKNEAHLDDGGNNITE